MLQRPPTMDFEQAPRVRGPRRWLMAARLAFAPTGLIAAGAGVGIGEVAGLPLAATITLGVVGWLARLIGTVSVRWFHRLPLVTIDPIAVAEPWRSLVSDALGARQGFDQIVAKWPPGPLLDRLVAACAAVHGATDEVWRVAQLGSSMSAPDRYAPQELNQRMRAIQRQPAPVTGAPDGYDEEAALAYQLQAVHRRRKATARVEIHVRRVVTQMNVAVTDLAGLALGADATLSAFDSIDHLSDELASLHQAIGEIGS